MQSNAECIPQGRICIKSRGRFAFVDVSSICWIKSAGNYVKIRLGGSSAGEYLVRDTLQSFEDRLDGSYFVRIHRSVIVNARRIRELRPWYTGEYIITLDNGKELTLSRSYRRNLSRLLKTGAAA
ncbi:MAG: LytR/AlgR family response regulator transcription factor [Acidobacteriaceae bacterium]